MSEVKVENNKHIAIMISNELDFDGVERRVEKEAKEYYGDTIFDDIYLPSNYNLQNLDIYEARKFDLQECQLPFSDETINNLVKMPKILINEVFNFNHNGKSIHGSYLLGKHEGKYVLFLLKIESSCEIDNFTKFSIKLDACIQGKAWLTLMRLDSSGHQHPNYIKDGKVVKKQSDMTYARAPHLHQADHITQILTDTKSYTLARELPFFDYEKDSVSDKYMFKKIVDYFLGTCNIKAKINDLVKDDYFYSKTQPLFDYDVPNINKPSDLDGREL